MALGSSLFQQSTLQLRLSGSFLACLTMMKILRRIILGGAVRACASCDFLKMSIHIYVMVSGALEKLTHGPYSCS